MTVGRAVMRGAGNQAFTDIQHYYIVCLYKRNYLNECNAWSVNARSYVRSSYRYLWNWW
jgi:hypothetical protein